MDAGPVVAALKEWIAEQQEIPETPGRFSSLNYDLTITSYNNSIH